MFGWNAYSEMCVAFMKAYGGNILLRDWKVRRLLGVYFVKIKS